MFMFPGNVPALDRMPTTRPDLIHMFGASVCCCLAAFDTGRACVAPEDFHYSPDELAGER